MSSKFNILSCDEACVTCIKSYKKKHDLKAGESFAVSCSGIPKEYMSPSLSEGIPDTIKSGNSILDPVAWAAEVLDWHCIDPDGSVWKRKTLEGTLGGVEPYDEDKYGELIKQGKSAYNRQYQSIMLRCTARRKVFRIGRQAGKSETLVIAILHALFTNKDFKILLVTPYQSQIEEIFSRLASYINAHESTRNSLKRSVKAPNYTIELHNGSIVKGFTSGTKSGGNADAVRGQRAQMLVLDEADYLAGADINTVLSVITNYPDATVWMSSTPTGKREKFYEICFVPETLIQSQRGLLPIKELSKKDSCLTISGEYQNITTTMERYIDEKIRVIDVNHINMQSSLKLTMNHPIKTNSGWKNAKVISLNDFIEIPIQRVYDQNRPRDFQFSLVNKNEIIRNKIATFQGNLTRKEIAKLFNVSERTVSKVRSDIKKYGKQYLPYDKRKIKAIKKAQNFINTLKLSKEWYRLAGYYLAEGCIHRYSNKEYWSGINFTFNIKEKTYINEVIFLIKKLFGLSVKVKLLPKRHAAQLVIDSNWLGIAFYMLFGHSEDKKIPDFMLNKPYELELLETILCGDGHKRENNKYVLTLTASKVILQLYHLYLRNKIPVSFIKDKVKFNRKPTYTLIELQNTYKDKTWFFANNNFYTKVKLIDEIKYKGLVYNLEVDKDHTYTANLLGVHNCHNKLWKEYHYPSMINPLWSKDTEAFFRSQLDSLAYEHEVLASFGEQQQGVYQNRYIQEALIDYRYEDQGRLNNWQYCIGVDWNDVKIGTTIAVVGYDPYANIYKLVDRATISRDGWTQMAACNKIIEMNARWLPDYIYVDKGFGSAQDEILRKFGADSILNPHKGRNHPDSRLARIVKTYDFGSKITTKDLFTKQDKDRPAKPFLVENSVRCFEQQRIQISKYDTQLEAELRGYIIDHITTTGLPVYKAGNEKAGDHNLDALNLALIAFSLEMTPLGRILYDTGIAFTGQFGEQYKPIYKQEETQEKHKPDMKRTNIIEKDKSTLTTNPSPAANTTQSSRRLWSWPGFGRDAPRPKSRDISKRGGKPPSRKNI